MGVLEWEGGVRARGGEGDGGGDRLVGGVGGVGGWGSGWWRWGTGKGCCDRVQDKVRNRTLMYLDHLDKRYPSFIYDHPPHTLSHTIPMPTPIPIPIPIPLPIPIPIPISRPHSPRQFLPHQHPARDYLGLS